MAHQHIGVWLWYLVLLLRPHLFIYKPVRQANNYGAHLLAALFGANVEAIIKL